MTVLVTDTGFSRPTDAIDYVPVRTAHPGAQALDIPSDINLDDVLNLALQAQDLRIDFPSFADGRGFTLASRLRREGFKGTLRAAGHVIADQYAMARRCGFDAVEISDDLAQRQPEDQWLARANWQDNSYQNRLRGARLSLNQETV